MTHIADGHVHVWPHCTLRPHQLPIQSVIADGPHLLETMDRHGVAAAAVVTPAAMGFDNRFTLTTTALSPSRLVPIGRLDPWATDAHCRLKADVASGLKGIRLVISRSAELDWLDRPSSHHVRDVIVGADLVIHLHLLAEVTEPVHRLAHAFPGVAIVIDHLGRPDITQGVNASGFQQVLQLATLPHVFIKTPASGAFSMTAAPYPDLIPFIDAAIRAYSTRRLLWGSDWPACLAYGTYADSFAPLRSREAWLSESELTTVFGATFERLYRSGV